MQCSAQLAIIMTMPLPTRVTVSIYSSSLLSRTSTIRSMRLQLLSASLRQYTQSSLLLSRLSRIPTLIRQILSQRFRQRMRIFSRRLLISRSMLTMRFQLLRIGQLLHLQHWISIQRFRRNFLTFHLLLSSMVLNLLLSRLQ